MAYKPRWGHETRVRQRDSAGREYWISVDRPGEGQNDAYDKKVSVYPVGESIVGINGHFTADEINRNLVHAVKWAWCIAANNGGYRNTNSIHMLQKHRLKEMPKKRDTFRTVFVQDDMDSGKFTTLEFELPYRQYRKFLKALTYGVV